MKIFGGHRTPQRLFALIVSLSVVLGLAAGVATPANAQSAPLPRYLPTSVPAGYVMGGSEEGRTAQTKEYLHILRDASNTKEFVISGVPSTKESASFLVDVLVDGSGKKVRVHGKPAKIATVRGNVVVAWFERNRVISVTSAGSTSKAVMALASGVYPTKKGDGSFVIKKIPAGFTTLFAGSPGSLLADTYSVAWSSSGGILIMVVANVEANYLELISGPTGGTTPASVNSKPAFSIQRAGIRAVVWMEQPNLVIQIVSTELNIEGLLATAASVAPLDEAAFQLATTPVNDSSSGSGGGLPEPVSGPVAAGNIAGAPWVATISGQCVRFALSKVKVETCLPGFTSPSAVVANVALVNAKPVAVGVTGASVATVVFSANGAEVSRVATSPIPDQPGLRYFVVEVPTDVGLSASGLDAAGTEISPAAPVKKA